RLVGSAKRSPPTSGSGSADPFRPTDQLEIPIGALEGATLNFSATPARLSGLHVRALRMVDPDGEIILFTGDEVNEADSGSMSLHKKLNKSGTWQLVIGAKPGPQGKMTYKYTINQPGNVDYVAEE